MAFITVDMSDFDAFIKLLDEKTKDENIHKIAEKGLSEGFKFQQDKVKNSWSHENSGKPRKSKIVKDKTIDYLLHDDTPLWKKDFASLGTGFLFDNSIDPNSPQAVGGIIAQYLAYGTNKDGQIAIMPDSKLKAAIAGKAIRDQAIKKIEDTCVEEFEKIFKEL